VCTREAFSSEGVSALLLAGLVVAVLVWLYWKKSPQLKIKMKTVLGTFS
jgi:hypothetical protein